MDAEEGLLFEDDCMNEMARRNRVPARKKKERGKKAGKQLLSEVKVRMVMRIYGVSRMQAMEIINKGEKNNG